MSYPQQNQSRIPTSYQHGATGNSMASNMFSNQTSHMIGYPPPPPPPPPQLPTVSISQYPTYSYGVQSVPQSNNFIRNCHENSSNMIYGVPPNPSYMTPNVMNTTYQGLFPPPPPPPPLYQSTTSYIQSQSVYNNNNGLNPEQTCRNNSIPNHSKFRKQFNNLTKPNQQVNKLTNTTINNVIEPTVEEIRCTTCDVSFATQTAYQTHVQAHVKCSHPECTFEATPKLLSSHYSSKHGKYSGRGFKTITVQIPTGGNGGGAKNNKNNFRNKKSQQGQQQYYTQKFRICVGNHPDDLRKWIEERKKRFPTRSNIALKEKKRLMSSQLEVLDPQNHDNSIYCFQDKKRKREVGDDGRGMSKNDNEMCASVNIATIDQDNINCDSDLLLDTNGKVDNHSAHNSEQNDVKDNLLSSLMDGYGSSSEEDDAIDHQEDADKDIAVVSVIGNNNEKESSDLNNDHDALNQLSDNSTKPLLSEMIDPSESERNCVNCDNFKTKLCKFFLRNGSCKNGDNCTYIHDSLARADFKLKQEKQRALQSQRDRSKNSKSSHERKNNTTPNSAVIGGDRTLLRKLLHNDIRRERSLTLQVLRYIVDCNYLQKKRGDNF